MDQSVTAQIEARLAAAIEHMDMRRVADAIERAVQRDRVVHPERSHLLLGYRHLEVVMCHYDPVTSDE